MQAFKGYLRLINSEAKWLKTIDGIGSLYLPRTIKCKNSYFQNYRKFYFLALINLKNTTFDFFSMTQKTKIYPGIYKNQKLFNRVVTRKCGMAWISDWEESVAFI